MCANYRFSGVSWRNTGGFWEAYVHSKPTNERKVYLGCFANEEEAAKVVDEYRKKMVGNCEPTISLASGRATFGMFLQCLQDTGVPCKYVICPGVACISHGHADVIGSPPYLVQMRCLSNVLLL